MTRPRPAKHLRPTVDNRKEAVELIATGLKETAEEFAESEARSLDRVLREIRAPEAGPSSLSVGCSQLFFYGMSRACARILEGDTGGWEGVRDCLAVMYWGGELIQHESRVDSLGYDLPTGQTPGLMSFHGLALAGSAAQYAAWQTPFLHNLVVGGSAETDVFEPDLVAFYRELTGVMLSQRWPAEQALPDDLGEFRALLSTAGDDELFEAALMSYCDFRLSRAFQFVDSQASKPRRPSDTMFVFESQWLALFPFELFSLKGAYQVATGKQLLLDAPHALLHTPLTRVPALTPLADTALTRDLQAYGKRHFVDQWQPLTRVSRL